MKNVLQFTLVLLFMTVTMSSLKFNPYSKLLPLTKKKNPACSTK